MAPDDNNFHRRSILKRTNSLRTAPIRIRGLIMIKAAEVEKTWHEKRASGVGSSDAPAVLGCGYATHPPAAYSK